MSTTKKVKIIVPGSSNADLTGFAPHLPAAGETVMGSSLHIGIGGKGCNQMTAAARAGADAWFITRVGQDVFGETLRRHFAAEGFRDRYIREDGTAETGCALIEIDERDGQNRILVIPGVNRNIGAEDVRAAEADFADADAVLTQLEIDLSAVAEAKRLAQAAGQAVPAESRAVAAPAGRVAVRHRLVHAQRNRGRRLQWDRDYRRGERPPCRARPAGQGHPERGYHAGAPGCVLDGRHAGNYGAGHSGAGCGNDRRRRYLQRGACRGGCRGARSGVGVAVCQCRRRAVCHAAGSRCVRPDP